jgi:hypothetical protein
LLYYREKSHFIIVRETADKLEILDFLYERVDLVSHIEMLSRLGPRIRRPVACCMDDVQNYNSFIASTDWMQCICDNVREAGHALFVGASHPAFSSRGPFAKFITGRTNGGSNLARCLRVVLGNMGGSPFHFVQGSA